LLFRLIIVESSTLFCFAEESVEKPASASVSGSLRKMIYTIGDSLPFSFSEKHRCPGEIRAARDQKETYPESSSHGIEEHAVFIEEWCHSIRVW
jgi:hypothetical protein